LPVGPARSRLARWILTGAFRERETDGGGRDPDPDRRLRGVRESTLGELAEVYLDRAGDGRLRMQGDIDGPCVCGRADLLG